MKFKVDKDSCIGCGACQAICGEIFEINDVFKVEEIINVLIN